MRSTKPHSHRWHVQVPRKATQSLLICEKQDYLAVAYNAGDVNHEEALVSVQVYHTNGSTDFSGALIAEVSWHISPEDLEPRRTFFDWLLGRRKPGYSLSKLTRILMNRAVEYVNTQIEKARRGSDALENVTTLVEAEKELDRFLSEETGVLP